MNGRRSFSDWAPLIALTAAFIASGWYQTSTINKRIDDLSSRVDRLESRIDRLDNKIDALDAKFDKLLIALAGRGVTVPAKTGKTLHSKEDAR